VIILVGLPGSGKSTIGKHLARKLAFCFVDSDHVIESRIGCSIRQYFEEEGEDRFRDVEQQVLTDLVQGTASELAHVPDVSRVVLSSGGGAVLRQGNREVMRQASAVVYLRASAEELYKRLKHDKTRPLLQVVDPLKRLRDLFTHRDPLYLECAEFVFDTGRPSVSALILQIQSQLELTGKLPSVQK
jgi:shikimate kinase